MVHVAYRGEAPAINDAVAGQIPMMFANLSSVMGHLKGGESYITPEKRATIYQAAIPLRLVLTDVQFYGARRRRPFECAPLVVAATIFSKQSKVNDLFEIAPCGFVRQLKIPRDAGNGRRPAFNECQDHGSVNNNQLKVFSEAKRLACAPRSSAISVLQ